MKAKLLGLVVSLTALLLLAAPAHADTAGLQLNPLQYEDTFTTPTIKTGYIDVANPSDAAITVTTHIKGFRQTDLEGHLSFFDDPTLSAGIQVGLDQFELGPHEAVRVVFNADPAHLPRGGVYAAIFFQTTPAASSGGPFYIAESANLGTLLILNNGQPGQHLGSVTTLSVPWLQIGQGVAGSLIYRNTDQSRQPVGFQPALTAQVLPWSGPHAVATGLLLPGRSRQFNLQLTGSYVGPLPLTITDADSGHQTTQWILACTGLYRYVIPLFFVALALVIGWRGKLRRLLRWLQSRLKRRGQPTKRLVDGLSPPLRDKN